MPHGGREGTKGNKQKGKRYREPAQVPVLAGKEESLEMLIV